MTTQTLEAQGQQTLKVGVMGAAGHGIAVEHLRLAEELGEAVAVAGCVLITGGCPGLPLAAAKGAKWGGGTVIGISPGLSLEEHAFKFESPTVHHDVLIFTGSGLMGREVVNIRSSDIVVIIGGSSGTLGELAIAYDEGKLIGVLTGTGGISDLVESILAACNKQTGARGRSLQDGAKFLRMHGQNIPVRAHIEMLHGLSAHADQSELIRWLAGFQRAPQQTFLVHGEPQSQRTLADVIRQQLGWNVAIARDAATAELTAS